MVLYSVVTTYHLLEAIVHKLNYNQEKKGVLLISKWLADKYPWYRGLNIFFQTVIVFEGSYFYTQNMQAELKTYFTHLFHQNNLEINEFEEVHVFGAEHSFGTYIFSIELECFFWEEGAGALSKKDDMFELFSKTHGEEKAKYQYEQHLGDGDRGFVKKRFYDKYFQQKNIEGDNLIHFDVTEELGYMKESDRENLIALFYGKEKINSDKSSVLLLTECFANISIMTWEEQISLYQYICDFFLADYRILIKPHPDDLMPYEQEIANSKVIRKRFPAELLPYIFEGRPEVVATASSTSIYGMRRQFWKVLEFNFRFSHGKQFYRFTRYFVALSLIKPYMEAQYQLNLLGVNSAFIDNFYTFCSLGADQYVDCGSELENTTEIGERAVWLMDEIKKPHEHASRLCSLLRNLPEDNVVVFINSDEEYGFYNHEDKELWSWMVPVGIREERRGKSVTFSGPSVSENQTETIYIYTKGAKVNMLEIRKELPNVGTTVSAEYFEADKLQIKVLEGMLEATEKRLLYYIEREKELSKKLGEKQK